VLPSLVGKGVCVSARCSLLFALVFSFSFRACFVVSMKYAVALVLLLASLLHCSEGGQGERTHMAFELHSASQRQDIPGSSRLPTLLARRALTPGSQLALRRFMERWRAGEELTVAVVGGSVSLGQECKRCGKYDGTFSYTWSRLVFDALASAQPGAKLHYVNGAVGGAGAAFFSTCLAARVPLDEPTLALVFVEVAVNSNQYDLAGVEGIVRGLLGRRGAVQPEPLSSSWTGTRTSRATSPTRACPFHKSG
jgi:hypothetical protein